MKNHNTFHQIINNKTINTLFKACVSITLVSYLALILDWQKVTSLNGDIFWVLAAGCCIFFSALMIMALRWKLMLNYQSVSAGYINLLKFYTIAQFFNIFLPTAVGGDAIRIAYSNHTYQLGWKYATAIVISERLFGLAALMLIATVSFAFNKELLIKFSVSPLFASLLILAAIISFFVAKYLAAKKVRISFGLAFSLLLLSAASQFTDVLIVYMLAQYFALHLTLADLTLVISVVYLVTLLPISVGGLGVREGSMVALLALFQVEPSIAILISLSLYITKLCIGLFGYFVYLKNDKIQLEQPDIKPLL